MGTNEEQFKFIKGELDLLFEFEENFNWAWLGATDFGSEGHWYYPVPLRRVPQFLWQEGHPVVGHDQTYMVLERTHGWNAKTASDDYFAEMTVCQKFAYDS